MVRKDQALLEQTRPFLRCRIVGATVTSEGSWRIPLSDVLVDPELLTAASAALESGWWTMGPRVEAFEDEFKAFCGTEYAVAVSSGTAALHVALTALGCGPGDEVVLPSLNFVAAANTVLQTGAEPVFCDIRGADDLNLDPEDVAAAVGPRTKAIVVLHYAGFPCDASAVREVAEERGIVVVEDAAHAPGARVGDAMCGTLGRVGCFSFFSNKNLPVGEGGMVVTDDADLVDRMHLLRSHGMTTLTWDRHRGHAHTYDVVAPGFNYRLDEVRAAVGLVQLRRIEQTNAARARLAARYRAALNRADAGISVPFADVPGVTPAHHLAVVVLPPAVDRERVREAMQRFRIQTSVHYPPIHHFSLYKRNVRALPRTDAFAGRLLTLPLYAHMTEDQVDEVVEALLESVSRERSS